MDRIDTSTEAACNRRLPACIRLPVYLYVCTIMLMRRKKDQLPPLQLSASRPPPPPELSPSSLVGSLLRDKGHSFLQLTARASDRLLLDRRTPRLIFRPIAVIAPGNPAFTPTSTPGSDSPPILPLQETCLGRPSPEPASPHSLRQHHLSRPRPPLPTYSRRHYGYRAAARSDVLPLSCSQ